MHRKDKLMSENNYIIYTDGSSLSNPGPCGAAYIILKDNVIVKEKSIPIGEGTNNIAELTAVIHALKDIKPLNPDHILIFADSQYVINGATNWYKSWQKHNWKSSSNKKVLNIDLWKELILLVEEMNPEFKWVKGHDDDEYNEQVDKLAKKAAEAIKKQTT